MMKVDKQKYKKNQKKFPELKMAIGGEYRNSNNTMLSEDEMLNVSIFISFI